MQRALAGMDGNVIEVVIPASCEEVIPGVTWGRPEHFNTPAYWAVRCRWEDQNPSYSNDAGLLREAAFCLLGGFGIKYEVNAAAFARLDERGFFQNWAITTEAELRDWLVEPLDVQGRRIRYRFPNQRAHRLAGMCKFFLGNDLVGLESKDLRDRLLEIDGIGPKTASWIVRNSLGANDVAIIDVHLIRACQRMKVFPEEFVLPRDYEKLESRFLAFSRAIDVPASVLDAVMWTEARNSPTLRGT